MYCKRSKTWRWEGLHGNEDVGLRRFHNKFALSLMQCTGYSNLQSLYIFRHTSGWSPDFPDGCTYMYTNWESPLLLLHPSRSPNENRWLVFKRLFDWMVAPTLDYGAPVWSRFCSLREVEKLQNQVYRFFLGVSSKHPLAAASGDSYVLDANFMQT